MVDVLKDQCVLNMWDLPRKGSGPVKQLDLLLNRTQHRFFDSYAIHKVINSLHSLIVRQMEKLMSQIDRLEFRPRCCI